MKDDTLALTERIRRFASEKNAEKVVVLDVQGLCSYTDALIVCHGRSTRQAQTIADHIVASLKQEGDRALGVEGATQGHWILIDFADAVVHVFYEPVREFYDIEGIWPEAKKVAAEA